MTPHCPNCMTFIAALREIATAEECIKNPWHSQQDGNPYRNTCCMETESEYSVWCVTCVAAHALGWSTDELVRQCARPEYHNHQETKP